MNWFEHPICVPFGSTSFDQQYYASHDMDVQTPPNTEITALLPGTVSSIASPTWGVTVGIKLDQAYNGIPYYANLHLAASNPALSVGSRVRIWDIIGWSGGCNTPDQYAGTSNPTGQNFLNSLDQSSQPQTGIALMRGIEYGGLGWEVFPPIDPALDPTSLVWRMRAAYRTWKSLVDVPVNTDIAQSWFIKYLYGQIMPPPTNSEGDSFNWNGVPIKVQEFGPWRCEWDSQAHWHKY